jgi:PAS domain-containing protein
VSGRRPPASNIGDPGQHPNIAVQWLDRQGRVIYWNPASTLLYGRTAEEAQGKMLDPLILDPEAAPAFSEPSSRYWLTASRLDHADTVPAIAGARDMGRGNALLDTRR